MVFSVPIFYLIFILALKAKCFAFIAIESDYATVWKYIFLVFAYKSDSFFKADVGLCATNAHTLPINMIYLPLSEIILVNLVSFHERDWTVKLNLKYLETRFKIKWTHYLPQLLYFFRGFERNWAKNLFISENYRKWLFLIYSLFYAQIRNNRH